MRLKILLGILGVLIIVFAVYLVFFWPESEASGLGRGGGKRTAPSSSPSPSAIPTAVTSATPAVTLFSDDFSGTLAKWQVVYDGYGTVQLEDGLLSMAPKASTQPSETHAPLVLAGETTWGDYIFSSKMNTVSQLRTGSAPNAWEVGWLVFRAQDASHFYYFIQKPNGFELGKLVGTQQIFLQTGETPTLTLGQWNNYQVTLKGANIKVSINGTQVANFTDTSSPYLTGKIGLYNEDAHAHYDDIAVIQN